MSQPHITDAPMLPALSNCLRPSPEEMEIAARTLWFAGPELYFTSLGPADRQRLSARCRPDQRELDDAYVRLCRDRPEIAEATQVSDRFLADTIDREVALGQLRSAGTTVGQGILDGMLLIRTGLYGLSQEVRRTVRAMIAEQARPWTERHRLSALWEDATTQARRLADRQAAGRDKAQRAEGIVSQAVERLAKDGETRRAVERLLIAARGRPTDGGVPALPFLHAAKDDPDKGGQRSANRGKGRARTSLREMAAQVNRAAEMPAAAADPAEALLLELPASARPFFQVPAERLLRTADQIAGLFEALDLPEDLSEAQRAALAVPHIAGALGEAPAHARALRYAKEVVVRSGVEPARITELCEKHSKLRVAGEGARRFLAGVDDALLVTLAARGVAQQRVWAFIQGELALLPEGSKERAALLQATAEVRTLEERQAAAEAAERSKEERLRSSMLDRMEEAERDLHLGEVMDRVRAGLPVAAEELIEAARHYERQLARRGDGGGDTPGVRSRGR